jgi:hypothetical protein
VFHGLGDDRLQFPPHLAGSERTRSINSSNSAGTSSQDAPCGLGVV